MRNPMNKSPVFIDQKSQLQKMPAATFALGHDDCGIFQSITIKIPMNISAFIVHCMMESAIPCHAFAVYQPDFFNDIRTVRHVGHVAEQFVRFSPRSMDMQENGAENEAQDDTNSCYS